MEELDTREKIELKFLIIERENLIKKLVMRKIDESYFRRENLAKNHVQESETQLVSATKDVTTLEKVLDILEQRIESLLKVKK